MLVQLLSLSTLIAVVIPAAIEPRSVSGNAIVNLDVNTGVPQHLASGFIYGIPDVPDQIPDHFYSDIDFQWSRAGGAQVLAPGRGWIWGTDEYKNRFASALSNYQTTRQQGGSFVYLIHDLWGADSTENSTAPFPGDNGDWTSWDNYLTQWISDMKASNATERLVIDIWNEPDQKAFWNRKQGQWIQLWGRTYYRLRQDFPEAQISGPTLSGAPSSTNTWWTKWVSFIATNGSVPDQYVWHMEGGGGDMQTSVANYKSLLSNAGLPTNAPININEYATFAEQLPSGGAWWISQLERVNAIGLRGNWLSTTQLHDFMAGLLGKPNASTSAYNDTEAGYWPAAEFQVYKYYAQNMTGYRVQTSPTPDLHGDVYATVGEDKVHILAGARITTGTWGIQLNNLTSLGLPANGTLGIQTWGFEGSSDHFQEFDGPVDLGVYSHDYMEGTLQFPVYQTDASTAYAFEFDL